MELLHSGTAEFASEMETMSVEMANGPESLGWVRLLGWVYGH